MTQPDTHADRLSPEDRGLGATAHDRILGEINADRPCTKCGFTLFGQPITREPHYGLLIAWGPECGTVASVQEYPLVSRWVGRLVAVGATAWVLLVLGLFTLGAWATMGVAYDVEVWVTEPIVDRVALAHAEWSAPAPAPTVDDLGTDVVGPGTPDEPYVDRWAVLDESFVASPAFAQARKGAFPGLTPSLSVALFWLGFTCFVLAVVWSVVLIHQGRLVRLLVCAAQLGVACTMLVVMSLLTTRNTASGGYTAMQAAYEAALVPTLVLTAASAAFGYTVGTLSGRPLVRQLLRAALPPRLRVPFHALWRVDGKAPPKP